MKLTHVGMRIDAEDWQRLLGHLRTTLVSMEVPEVEREQVLGFVDGLRGEIVDG